MAYVIKPGVEYDVIELDLGIERSDMEIKVKGDVISVLYLDGSVQVKINKKENPPIELDYVSRIDLRPLKFKKLYFSNTAQTGKKCVLAIGKEASFSATGREIVDAYLRNTTGDRINPSTEDTLSGIKAQTDKLQFDADNNLKVDIASSDIQVPVDLQSILPKKAELYNADLTVDQEVSLDIGGFKTVEVYAEATSATTFIVEFSFDNVHWFEYYRSPTAETKYNDVFTTCAQYIRLRSLASGVAGDTVTLVIGAKP